MYCTDVETLKARKIHLCHSCGQRIDPGSTYKRWRCYDGGDVGTNKMHPECYSMHEDDAARLGESKWEFSPFSYERPT